MPMSRALCRVALPAALFATVLPALANRPLNTETADIVEPGVTQFEAFASSIRSSGTPTETGWTAQAGIGIGHRTQANIGVGRATAAGESASAFALGGKSWLVELGDDSPGVTVAYGLTAVRAAGDSWRRDASFVTLVGTRPFGKDLLVHANVGWQRSAVASQTSTTWALGLEYTLPAQVDLIAETFGDDRSKPAVSLGLRWHVHDKFSLNTSYGVALETPRVRRWTLGLELDF